MIQIYPAIDLSGGRVVRLTQGDYDRMTVYSDSPLDTARAFLEAGATHLHVVDLDGAKDGTLANQKAIAGIASLGSFTMQVGGGIRSRDRILRYLDAGVSRVILGTVAVRDPDFVKRSVDEFGARIAVGVDARDGMVAVNGWLEKTSISAFDFCLELQKNGVETIIYTDISKDGNLTGTNLQLYRKLAQVTSLHIIASGGITYEEEVLELDRMGIYGAILGKALYAGKLDLRRVLQLTKGES